MNDRFFAASSLGTSLYEEKKSRFLGFACCTQTVVEADAFLSDLRAKHSEARHVVYAYLANFGAACRQSDDGEPQGTGGAPLFDALQKAGLTNTTLAVVRYFGGVLLGAGPLARAYGKAARAALVAAGSTEFVRVRNYVLSVEYDAYRRLATELTKRGIASDDPVFSDAVRLAVFVPLEKEDSFLSFFRDLTSGKGTPELCGESFRPIPPKS